MMAILKEDNFIKWKLESKCRYYLKLTVYTGIVGFRNGKDIVQDLASFFLWWIKIFKFF